VGPEKYRHIIPRDAAGNLDVARTTSFVTDAHAVGLLVHPFTFRAENAFLPSNLRSSASPTDLGRSEEEMITFLNAGIDGFFTDQSDIGVAARDAFVQTR
jgi:glycerophosphoryl diester phosphodiesterase